VAVTAAVVQAGLVDCRRDACARPCGCRKSECRTVLRGAHLRVSGSRDPVWRSNRPIGEGSVGGERFGFGLESWKWQQVGARAWPPFPKSNDRMRSYSFCYIARFAGLQENCSDGGVRQRGNVALWRPARPFVNIEFWWSGKMMLLIVSFERRRQPGFGKTYSASSRWHACATEFLLS